MFNAMRAIGGESDACVYRWMLDNGIYGGKWKEDIWIKRLKDLRCYRNTCIAVVVPDVLYDADGTLQRWHKYVDVVKGMGYPAAFVSQNGTQCIPDNADTLFVGGDDQHKLHDAWPLIHQARDRQIWVHVGRVNSIKRMKMFAIADSCDGTTLAKEPSVAVQERLWRTANEITVQKQQATLFTLDS